MSSSGSWSRASGCTSAPRIKTRNWVRNIKVKPNVIIKAGGETFDATVSQITEAAERDQVMGLVQRKYWYAAPIMMIGRMLQGFGFMKDNTGAFEVYPA